MKLEGKRKIALIGVPVDLGAGTQGTNLGPEAIRIAGMVKRLETIGYSVDDRGDIPADRRDARIVEGANLKNLNEIVKVNSLLCKEVSMVMEEGMKIAGEGTDGIHVSFDLDAVDPEVAPGTGTKVPGGMGYRETHHAMEMIAMSNKLVSVEFVEVNPLLDRQNTTAEVTVALAGSLLGEWLI